jgi:AhpC/TSA family
VSAPWVTAFITLSGVVVVLGLIVLGTLRRLAPVIEQAEETLGRATATAAPGGLETGAAVPPFVADTVQGRTFTERNLHDAMTVVLFIGTDCTACDRLVDDLANDRASELQAQVVVVTRSEHDAAQLAQSAAVTVLADTDQSVAGAFMSQIVPHAFVLEGGTVLNSGRPSDWEAVEALVASIAKGGDQGGEVAREVLSPT